MHSYDPISAEKELAAMLEAGEENAAIQWLDAGNALAIEFTCRCYALAISGGLAKAAARMGQAGFHLAVTDDSAAQRAIEQASSMRGLLSFLGEYRYCKAQRTYYLPIVESALSCEPIKALLQAGLLTEHDKSELLSLSLRMSNHELARILAEGGANLVDDIRQDIPQDLIESNEISISNTGRHWAEMATPQRTLETLELIFEQIGDMRCSISGGWWGSYQRQEGFAAKLSAIAQHGSSAHCDCTERLLATLAESGELSGLKAVCAWSDLEPAWLDAALAKAQEAGHPEAAAILISARHNTQDELDLLDF